MEYFYGVILCKRPLTWRVTEWLRAKTDASEPAARPEVHANFKAVTTSEVMSVELLWLFVPWYFSPYDGQLSPLPSVTTRLINRPTSVPCKTLICHLVANMSLVELWVWTGCIGGIRTAVFIGKRLGGRGVKLRSHRTMWTSRPSYTKRKLGHGHNPASCPTDWLRTQWTRSHSCEHVNSNGTVRTGVRELRWFARCERFRRLARVQNSSSVRAMWTRLESITGGCGGGRCIVWETDSRWIPGECGGTASVSL